MNAGGPVAVLVALRPFTRAGHRLVVIRLPAARQRVGIVPEQREMGPFLDRPPAVRSDHAGEMVAVDPEFVVAVTVDVAPLEFERLSGAQLSLRPGELPPNPVSEMGKVETPEDPVPIGVVALRPSDGS